MNKKVWNDLKSRRDLAHRIKRRLKRAGELQHERETPERLKGLSRPSVSRQAEIPPEKKTAPVNVEVKKPGIFRRIYRRVVGG